MRNIQLLTSQSFIVPHHLNQAIGAPLLSGCTEKSSQAESIRTNAFQSNAEINSTGPTVTVFIEGEPIARTKVLEWEARRLQVVAQRMQGNWPSAFITDLTALFIRPATSIENIATERELLAKTKIKAGDNAMRQLVAMDLFMSDPVGNIAAQTKQYSPSTMEIHCSMGSAEEFALWYQNAVDKDRQYEMLLACPDHYLIRTAGKNGQEVIEETGGAMVITHFTIDYGKIAQLPYEENRDFPIRLKGAAVNRYGTQIGGVLHQFGNMAEGFKSKLTVFFPSTLPSWLVSEHRWHLACEFSNWIEMYVKEDVAQR